MTCRSAIALLLAAPLLATGCDRQSPAAGQGDRNAAATAPAASADEVPAGAAAPVPAAAQFDRSHQGEPAPTAAFTGPDGQATTLAAFRGKPLLVNLWATWCAPCVAEMPTLDRAARALEGQVRVIAVSQDMDGASRVLPFLSAKHLVALKPYLDPKLGLSLAFQANLPMTILYDADGREVWRRSGGFAWDGAEARARIAEAGRS